MKKRCPLLIAAIYASPKSGDFSGEADDCKEETCAWWLSGSEACAIVGIAQELLSLGIRMGMK